MDKISLVLTAALVLAASVVLSSGQVPTPKEINGGIVNGKAVELPKPNYPDDLKASKIEGTVVVDVVIDEGGNVISAKATMETQKMNKVGHPGETVDVEPADPALRGLAEEAALKAKFSPTLLNGEPVKIKGKIVYFFKADDISKGDEKPISAGVLNSRSVNLPVPNYPAAAAAVGAEGTVDVEVVVDESGNVISARAVSGHPLLQAAAVAAARSAKFSPTRLEGKPVKVSGVIVYNFSATRPTPK